MLGVQNKTDMYKDKNDIWKIFPSTSRIAYFYPLGSYIMLEKISKSQLKLVHKNPKKYIEHYSVLIHEMQHWMDHVATLWGQEQICSIFSAFECLLKADINNFHFMKSLYDNFKRDNLYEYYTEIYNEIHGNANQRWKYEYSCGVKFDSNGYVDNSKSIIFVRFKSHLNDPIARVPLSIVSLLETNATHKELFVKYSYFNELEENTKIIEMQKLYESVAQKLYNPNLTLYSVAVHTTANILNIVDPIIGYSVASQIATLALNLPSKLFLKIKIPISFQEKWKERNHNMLKNKDRGFAFLCLLQNYKNTFGQYSQDFSIEKLLGASLLPNIQEIEKDVLNEVENLLMDTLVDKNIFQNLITKKISTGNKIRKHYGIALEKTPNNHHQPDVFDDAPYILCNDTYFETDDIILEDVVYKLMSAQNISREEWWSVWEFCEKKIDSFNQICGI